jgi:hypothetical protein
VLSIAIGNLLSALKNMAQSGGISTSRASDIHVFIKQKYFTK